jgi:hypothetical protein
MISPLLSGGQGSQCEEESEIAGDYLIINPGLNLGGAAMLLGIAALIDGGVSGISSVGRI